jgi:hypothetical protein
MRFSTFKRFVDAFLVTAFFAICAAFSADAQPPAKEVEVPIIQKFSGKNFGCRAISGENEVIDEEKFDRIVSEPDCAALEKLLKVDFETESLISFNVRGDCHVSAAARVVRSDATKKYTVKIKKIPGGCRAAGRRQSWLVIEKIRPGYTVDFTETRVEAAEEGFGEELSPSDLKPAPPRKTEILETRAINLKGCIQTAYSSQFVIREEAEYLKTIRGDMTRSWCLKNLEKIDFGKHTLLGVEINSGYCRVPLGLRHQVVRDSERKKYLLKISYIDPRGSVCRALSRYDLWVLAPKLPAGYEVEFQISAVEPGK